MGNFPCCPDEKAKAPVPAQNTNTTPQPVQTPQPPQPQPQPTPPPPEVHQEEPKEEEVKEEIKEESVPLPESKVPELKVNASINKLVKFGDDEVRKFALSSDDLNPMHLDDKFAASMGFGKRIIHGMLLASRLGLMVSEELPGKGRLLSVNIDFKTPVQVGEAVTAFLKVSKVGSDGKVSVIGTCQNKQKKDVIYTKWEVQTGEPDQNQPSYPDNKPPKRSFLLNHFKKGKPQPQNPIDITTVPDLTPGNVTGQVCLSISAPIDVPLVLTPTIAGCIITPEKVTIPAGQTASEPFTIAANKNATPGSYYVEVDVVEGAESYRSFGCILLLQPAGLPSVGDVSVHRVFISSERVTYFREALVGEPDNKKGPVHFMLPAGALNAYVGFLPRTGNILLSGSMNFIQPAVSGEFITIDVKVTQIDKAQRLIVLSTICKNVEGKELITGEWKLRTPPGRV